MSTQLVDAQGEPFATWSVINDVVVIEPTRIVSHDERMAALRLLIQANNGVGHDYAVTTSFPEAVLWFNAGFTETSEGEFLNVRKAVDSLGKKRWVDLTFTPSLTERNEGYILKEEKHRRIGFHEHFSFRYDDTKKAYSKVYYTMMLANYVAWKQWNYFDHESFSAVKILQEKPLRRMEVTIEETSGICYVALIGVPYAYIEEDGGEEKLQKVIDDVHELAFSIGLGGYVSIKCYADEDEFLTKQGYERIAVLGAGYGTYALPQRERKALLRRMASSFPAL